MKKLIINLIRVLIPRNRDKKIKLTDLVIAQEAALGAGSPIASLDWAGKAADLAAAKMHRDKAEQFRRDAEAELELCDNLLAPIDDLLRQSRDILKGVYRKNPHKLGEWGFTVNASSPETSSIPKTK